MNWKNMLPKSSQPSLGIVAICKNEEKDLPGFLSHLLPWVDEIILVDDNSTDNTPIIAQAAGSKVHYINHPMQPNGGFAAQRNVGIQAATSDWLLHMDIDERVPVTLGKEILETISSTDYNGFRYRRLNYFLHRPMLGGGLQNWNNPQLGRRGFHRFEHIIHETCVIDGNIGQLNSVIWHLNDDSYTERMRKSFQYSQFEAQRYLEKNKLVHWYDFFVRPGWSFIKNYILKFGFRDGIPGLLFALHSADAIFRTLALAWDHQNHLSRQQLENQINIMWKSSDQAAICTSQSSHSDL